MFTSGLVIHYIGYPPRKHTVLNGNFVFDLRDWLQHVQSMDTNRLPKQALQYKPKGRRNVGRPRKRWRDKLHLEDHGTGNTPKLS